MADWRALAAGIETGQKLGTAARERKGRGLYGDVMTGQATDSYSASGIPMPGETEAQWAGRADTAEGPVQPMEGGTQEISYEGPTLKGQMAQLAEAYRLGGIDEDQFHTGVQNIGMRSYSGVKKNWDAFREAQDPKQKQEALQQLINMIPGSGMQYVVDTGNGNYATVPHDEDGQPIEGAEGLVLTPEMVDLMVMEATQDPNQWFKFVGMSTMDMADLEAKETTTDIAKSKEARAAELHPLEMGVKKSQIAKNQAEAASGGDGSSLAGWKPHQVSKAASDYLEGLQKDLDRQVEGIIDIEKREQAMAKGQQFIDSERRRVWGAMARGEDPFSTFANEQPAAAGAGRTGAGKVAGAVAAPPGAVKNPDGTVSDADGNVIGRWK